MTNFNDNLREKLAEAKAALEPRLAGRTAKTAIVLGSGLGSLADELTEAVAIPYGEIPHFAASSVVGHAGRLVVGKLDGHPLIAMQGRLHFYEGHSMQAITFPTRLLKAMGVETLILTNAAGGMNPDYRPGDLMGIRDHIFLPGMVGQNPLIGPNDEEFGPRFPPVQGAYTANLLALAQSEADKLGLRFHQGVYIMLSGPFYESGAELKFLRLIGGDAVGMSTVPETIVAAHSGMKVLGISTITNMATGAGDGEVNHEEVLTVGKEAGPKLARLIKGVLAGMQDG